jgi:NAD(P)-dependent dehydrogenase (short-subunit alcohol dehydrogenase family)
MMKRLHNKLALITGATRGLGRQLAIRFAREGAAGFAIAARNAAALRSVGQEILEINPRAHVLSVAGDLTNERDMERLAATTLSEFGGRLDVLVNNAAVLGPTPLPFLLDYPLDDFRAVLETNLIAPFSLIKKVLPAMTEQGGSIINISSDAGVVGYPGWGAYGISKFGLEGLSRTWAAELAGSKVRLNVVDPGSMRTEMYLSAVPDANPDELANPADVTEVFVYLASDASNGVHGCRFAAQEPDWGMQSIAMEGAAS